MKKMYVVAGVLFAFVSVVGYVAYRTRAVHTPKRRWPLFESSDAIPLSTEDCQKIEGIYTIEEGASFFGNTAVVKSSYVVEDGIKIFRLSLFCKKNGLFIIAEGRKKGNKLLLAGHWRKAAANGSGIVWMIGDSSAKQLAINARFGRGDKAPKKLLRLQYSQLLPQKAPLAIIAHRGGVRNVDFLHLSENSTDMLKMAAQLGANGVEIDVRMTKDGVPVLFHDSFLSVHTVKSKIYGGLLHNYMFEELKDIELRKGGAIPTLQECLHTILYHTPLETVWLDIKRECDLQKIVTLQLHYMEQAKAVDRDLKIYIGIPNKTMLGCFKKLPDYQNIPSLTEISPQIATEINAQVWAPQYTSGIQKEKVALVHSEGRKAFVWSLDSRFLIHLYFTHGDFDGLVTNTPSVVAHWYYTHQLHVEKKRQDELPVNNLTAL